MPDITALPVADRPRGPAAAVPAPAPATPVAPRRRSRSATVVALQARALAHESFRASATAVVTDLALLLHCDRVSVGFRTGSKVTVQAISNGAEAARQQSLVRAIAAAMDEAIDQRAAIVHPTPLEPSLAITLEHAELARANGRASICTVPVASRGGAAGAFLFERRDGFDADAVEVAKDAATFVGPLLELKHRLEQPLVTRIAEAVTPRRPAARRRVGAWGIGAALTLAALAVLAAWPATDRVVAPARVESAGQRIVAAPVDGFVAAAPVRPGEVVRAGQLLVSLENRDLASERDRWVAETAQLDKQYRDALTKDEAAQIVMARAKLESAAAQLELVERQLERARLVAPFDGVVLSGDLSQSVGAPVQRGQELMTVAPDRDFRVVAEVDEQDVGALRDGQAGRVLFGAMSGTAVPVRVVRIAPAAATVDGRNVFEVDAAVDAAAMAGLRPGMRGVARIDIGERSLGMQYAHRAWQWLRREWWRLLG